MAAQPRRIQRRRSRGWRMPPHCRYVGRPTIFGNPFRVGEPHPTRKHIMSAAECVAWYRRGLEGSAKAWLGEVGSIFRPEMAEVYDAWEALTPHLTFSEIEVALADLRGLSLCCWCPISSPCHADVLLELANG